MCCFSGAVTEVAGTRIFARVAGDRQLLAYQMRFSAAEDLAMVLPIPVPTGPSENAVRFIDLSQSPGFFDALEQAFPDVVAPGSAALASEGTDLDALQRLAVETVGAFEASFVPTARDFDRLDPRFRLSPGVLAALPGAADFGFVVFKLRAQATALHDVHPMAFEFPTRDPRRTFFPCVHAHDGHVYATAPFDHRLFVQLPPAMAPQTEGWTRSLGLLREHVTADMGGMTAPDALAWSRELHGMLPNQDVWLEGIPEAAAEVEWQAASRERIAALAAVREQMEAQEQRSALLRRLVRAVLSAPICAFLGFQLWIALDSHMHRERDGTAAAAVFTVAWLPSLWVLVEAVFGRQLTALIATGVAAVLLAGALLLLP